MKNLCKNKQKIVGKLQQVIKVEQQKHINFSRKKNLLLVINFLII